MVVYARYEYPDKFQLLDEHLVGVKYRLERILRAQPIAYVIHNLTRYIRSSELEKEILEAARIAAVFHDIGKAFHYYQEQKESAYEKGRQYMSFKFHEVISANLYAQTIREYLRRKGQYPYKQTWLVNLTLQAIILHHQGLRNITIEYIHNNKEINDIISYNHTKSIENVKKVIQKIYEDANINLSLEKIFLDILYEKADYIVKMYNPELIIDFYNLKCPVHVQISRLVTGCLMIADSWDAYQKVGGRASRYIREVVIDYLDTLKLLS
jgi:CRISPR-associated endonuclease Cas3-HD